MNLAHVVTEAQRFENELARNLNASLATMRQFLVSLAAQRERAEARIEKLEAMQEESRQRQVLFASMKPTLAERMAKLQQEVDDATQ